MPYSKEHKEKSRTRIVESASRLFPRLGFDAVSIDMLMAEAGLTRGAFYAHFSNKAEVYAESMVYSSQNSPFVKIDGEGQTDMEWFEQTIERYLSREHIDEAASPCSLAFLVTDINRRDDTVRDSYTRAYRNLNRLIQRRMKDGEVSADDILAATAIMIGGVALARALNDQRIADKLLRACRSTVRSVLQL